VAASYLFRMDDITPEMDWDRFLALMSLFKRHDIKPLLGLVPDNRDPHLARGLARPDFWDFIRNLQQTNTVDIAQHGYQHILVHRPGAALIGPTYGIKKEVSEFAGDPYADQFFRIREGLKILNRNGLTTTTWMAPNHSYDRHTLKALIENGFTSLSDGVALFPYRSNGLLFVPQTSWRPRWMPLGVHTICLHTNSITPAEVKRLRTFLRRPLNFTRFSDVVANYQQSVCESALSPLMVAHTLANQTYRTTYKFSWSLKRQLLRWRRADLGNSGKIQRPWQAQPQPWHRGSLPQQTQASQPSVYQATSP
jgi:predicted deacetylase